MSRIAGMIAAHRFGFGPAPGEVDRIAADPKGWLIQQLEAPAEVPAAMRDLPPASDNVLDWWDAVSQSVAELVRRIRRPYAALWIRESKAKLAAAIQSDQPFRERLVWFWGNHFTVSGRKAVAIGMTGGFEREAIRPHVTGRFADMLHQAVAHPGMLFYLDNYNSIGSRSVRAGYNFRGLNENLAREVLELHTLGVDAGYSQRDVREFAKMLTGWTLARAHEDSAGSFRFRPVTHEPGPKVVLGVSYPEDGEREARAMLDRLAGHEATAGRVAYKLARHFIADDPPPDAVAKLARVFRATEGDLRQVSLALIDLPEVWQPTLGKIKTHQEYVVAVMRAVGGEVDLDRLMSVLTSFGNLPFMAPSPAGWPDVAANWVNSDSALRRARFSADVASRRAAAIDPNALAHDTIAGLAPADTLRAIAGAASAEEGVALVLASPTMQRR